MNGIEQQLEDLTAKLALKNVRTAERIFKETAALTDACSLEGTPPVSVEAVILEKIFYKISRFVNNYNSSDSLLDIAGYALLLRSISSGKDC